MIVFILMMIKGIATLSQISYYFIAASIPMLLVWVTDHSTAALFGFKTAFGSILFVVYFLAWIIFPWMLISKRRAPAIAGLWFVIGSNLFDIICSAISALPILTKVLNCTFSLLIIGLSIIYLRRTAE